ncbi:MAG: hypothetical protein JWL77_689, partial [Chthonomonadaceae bacterium]|nr:hypothetical protein [Chthonomonadaceae bacterium]
MKQALWNRASRTRKQKPLIFRLLVGGILLAVSIACAGQEAAPALQAENSPRVTTHLKATTLPDTLKELSRLTGVRLESSEDTADLKVTMFVENL